MKKIHFCFIIILFCTITSCKKYLDKIADKSLAVPTTLKEFQALLDHTSLTSSCAGLQDLGTDDYYLLYSDWQTKSNIIRNAYTWQKDVYEGNLIADWSSGYEQVYKANIALDGIANIAVDSGNQAEWNTVKGNALFYRAFYFYNLQETFGHPYNPATASVDLGIPLRLTSDLNIRSKRSNIQQTFNQIIKDLMEAKDVVPVAFQITSRNRCCKPAVFAMLSRVYLTMQDYEKATAYADSCLNLYNALVDYNTLNASSTRPFPTSPTENAEVLLFTYQLSYGVSYSSTTIIDSTLYGAYNLNDLRKNIFYNTNTATGTKYFKGQYTGLTYSFSGLATDEVYLIRAECNARKNNITSALQDLNLLLIKRWKTGTFVPLTAISIDDAVSKILLERRKELVFRGIRWSDLRRLNQDTRYTKTLVRILNGQQYFLPPNDPKYTYPIPDTEIQLSGIQQNAR